MSRQAKIQTAPADEPGGRELAVMEEPGFPVAAGSEKARPIPRISIQAFCESSRTAEALQVAAEDRRLAKAHVSVHMGGVQAAVAHYQESPTPNLIVLDSALPRAELLGEIDRLAESCDSGTKVVVVGHTNDVVLYRELLKRGVSEYLIAPISPIQFMESVSNLYNDPDADPVGHVFAFIGAKGGVGSSTICHNAGWAISEILQTELVIADMDLPFGTAGLDFDKDPVQGIAEAISSPERLDEVLLDRLLTKCSEKLSLFSAPGTVDRDWDLAPDACEMVLDVVRQHIPHVVLDLPHAWNGWVRRMLLAADEIVITAVPDLANLRNAKNIVDHLKGARNNDGPPHLVINMHNTPKRPEIPIKEFAQALDLNPIAVIEFDAETFGEAANHGRMIEELNAKAKAVQPLRDIALTLTKRPLPKVEKKSPLAPLLEKLKLKR
ncbi:MAG TPA: CtpF protein [Hyphomicrobiaceae bacterium]|nr:CtpF protein [Hyphomicrobiaceae bacterium]